MSAIQATQVSQPAPSLADAGQSYTIQPGDTLSAIADRFGLDTGQLLAANPQISNPDRIYAGDRLTIPEADGSRQYTVRAGDTLSEIAQSQGVSLSDLVRANGITNPDRIYPGDVLTIPRPPGSTPVEAPPAPAPSPGPTPAPAPAPAPAPTPEAGGRFDYNQIAGVSGNRHVTPEFISEIEAMAGRLDTQPEYLLAVMSFETGGSFAPDQRNFAGSGATGLIQFMPATARGLGTSTDALAQMNSVEQLRFVEAYFAQPMYRGQLSTLEGVYTAVLSGRATADPNATLTTPAGNQFVRGNPEYTWNAALDLNGDGRITAGEATAQVAARLYGGVASVQRQLLAVGAVPEAQQSGFVDGSFGPNTAAAVARFQAETGLPQTGLLDDATGRALFGLEQTAPSQPAPAEARRMESGDRGADVENLQQQLVALGRMSAEEVATGPGIFGPRTESAVQAFQSALGLSPSGVADFATQAAISSIISGLGMNRGSNQDVVDFVQGKLFESGHLTPQNLAAERSVFGPLTEAALSAAQTELGIQATGILGAQTFIALTRPQPGELADLQLSRPVVERTYLTPATYPTIDSPVIGRIIQTEGFMALGGPHSFKGERYAIFSDDPTRVVTLPPSHGEVGIDYWVPDAQIRSWFSGVVEQVIPTAQSGGYGNMAILRSDQTFTYNGREYPVFHHYAHANSISVQAGQRVEAGQIIGVQGNTGASFGDHVDFRSWIVLENGREIDISPNLLVTTR